MNCPAGVVPTAAGGSVEYDKETSFTPGADVVAEGALKPETTLTYDNATGAIRTIPTWTKASVQSLADVPGLQAWLDSRVSYAVMLKAEAVFMADLLTVGGALTPDFTPAGGASPNWIWSPAQSASFRLRDTP